MENGGLFIKFRWRLELFKLLSSFWNSPHLIAPLLQSYISD